MATATSIYRRFRPKTFDEVIGQDHIVRTLTNQIKTGNIGHAYLFTGTRGTGKTSCAKIFAKAVNCLNPKNGSPCGECEVCKALNNQDSIDIIEIDAASNNGVDQIRDLAQKAYYRPTVAKYKVYIIDEVHMLSISAFNALLKTLEEPPEHVIFILATTEVPKVPQTILSRCIRFDFRLVDVDVLVEHLKYVFDILNVKYDEKALVRIAMQGEGSVRDTLSIADMCKSYCADNITYEDTLEILSATDDDTLATLSNAILKGDVKTSIEFVDKLLRNGRTTLIHDLADYLTNLIAVKNIDGYELKGMTKADYARLKDQSKSFTNYRISRVMNILASLETQLRFSTQPRVLIEANIVKACDLSTESDGSALQTRIEELEIELSRIKAQGIQVVQKPIVEEKKEVQKNTVEIPKEAESLSLEEILTKNSVEISSSQDTFTEQDTKDAEAMEIWSRIHVKIADSGDFILSKLTADIHSGISIEDNTFIVRTKDQTALGFLNDPTNIDTIKKYLKEETGKDYAFECREIVKKKPIVSPQSQQQLRDLFNNNIEMK